MPNVKRILLELFGPSALASMQMIFVQIVGSFFNKSSLSLKSNGINIDKSHLSTLFGVPNLFFQYYFLSLLFCGIQFIIYTILMECCYKTQLGQCPKKMMLVSTLLGLFSGFSTTINDYFLLGIDINGSMGMAAYMGVLGAISGLIISMITNYFNLRVAKIDARSQWMVFVMAFVFILCGILLFLFFRINSP